MGGQLNVNSILGKGSNFWLEIDLPTYTCLTPINLESDADYYQSFPISAPSKPIPPTTPKLTYKTVIPPQKVLSELLELTEIGDLQSLKKRLNDLEKSDIRFSAFTRDINTFAQNFQIHEILSYLNSLINV